VEGGSGSYAAVFAGRISWGSGPLTEFRSTVRNLRVTHRATWNSYEGEVNCHEFYRTSGYTGLKIREPWSYFRVTLYHNSWTNPREPMKLTFDWGCHLATTPPDMTRR
jgi:hypothetical protein